MAEEAPSILKGHWDVDHGVILECSALLQLGFEKSCTFISTSRLPCKSWFIDFIIIIIMIIMIYFLGE